MFAKIQRVHFVGIGGIGMSGIAEVLLTLGYKVSGSDRKLSPLTERLTRLGATVFEGHSAANIEGAEVVVTSSAIGRNNPEVAAARERHMADVENIFIEFMQRIPFYGSVILCNDDPRLRELAPRVQRRVVTYGVQEGSDFQIASVRNRTAYDDAPRSVFEVSYHGESLGEFRLHVPGAHNVLNATAAIAVGIGLEVPVEKIHAALEAFRGVDRRFQVKGSAAGVAVVDDYGHHPTEIRATLAAARQCPYQKIHVVFQPHRYTRTQLLMEEFATCFAEADSVAVLDIYAASEEPIEGVTGLALARAVNERGKKPALYAASFAEAAQIAASAAERGDLVLTLGAGNISQLAPQILKELKARETRAKAQASHAQSMLGLR